MSFTFSDGMLILIEGNKNKKEWFTAHEWQIKEFRGAMMFGQMKSMGHPLPLEKTKPFEHNRYTYRFHIYNDWGPCYLENMTTNKKREIKYFDIHNSSEELHSNKITTINNG